MTEIEMFRGAMIGGACGDALGYPLQELSVCRIQHKYGPFGLRTLVRNGQCGNLAPVTGNTQMELATVDGLLWTDAKKLEEAEGLYRGYMRWFYSQTGEEPRRGQRTWMRRQPHEREICLVREKFMHARRKPEEGLLNAFSGETMGTTKNKVNESKGGGALTRVVPIGLLYAGDSKTAFNAGVRAAAFSHSTPVAYYAAGAVSALIACLADGMTLPKAIERIHGLLNKTHRTDSITTLLSAAQQQANDQPAGKGNVWAYIDSIHSLGSGDQADEALAIAVYAALAVDDPVDAIIAAANHNGNSPITAALTGAIEGVRFGADFLPNYWKDLVEGEEIIAGLADKLYHLYEKRLRREKPKHKTKFKTAGSEKGKIKSGKPAEEKPAEEKPKRKRTGKTEAAGVKEAEETVNRKAKRSRKAKTAKA